MTPESRVNQFLASCTLIVVQVAWLDLPAVAAQVTMGVLVPTQLERRQTWGGYPYARDLVELQGRKRKEAVRVTAGAASVQTPLKTQEWEEWLRPHPDRVYAQYIRVAGSEGGLPHWLQVW